MRYVYEHNCIYKGRHLSQRLETPDLKPRMICNFCEESFTICEMREDRIWFSKINDPEKF